MIYILKFSEPLHHAKYYVGWCEDGTLMDRVGAHRKGRGAAITRAAVQRGLTLSLVVAFPGDRHLERRIKRWKNTPKLVARLNQKGWRAWPQQTKS